MTRAPADSIFAAKFETVDHAAAAAVFPKADVLHVIQQALGRGMQMRKAARPEADASYARIGRACLALILASEHLGVRRSPAQMPRSQYRELIREIKFCARTIVKNADTIVGMAFSGRSEPDPGMIGALEELGRSLATAIHYDTDQARESPLARAVRREEHRFSFVSAHHPLRSVAALYNAAERVEAGLNGVFASSGSAGNRPNHDLHDFLSEIVADYQDIVMPPRLSAAPSKAGTGLQSSPLGRFVDGIFDLMEKPDCEPIPLPIGWRPSASTLRDVVDRLNGRDAA